MDYLDALTVQKSVVHLRDPARIVFSNFLSQYTFDSIWLPLKATLKAVLQHLTELSIKILKIPPMTQGKTMASELIKHISDDTFEKEVLQSSSPVLVDYWAEWCGPCKMIAPILDEIAGTYEGKLQVTKMNVDDNREIPGKFGIRGIPTLMLFKNGQLAATKVGALSKSQLTEFIDQQLA
jgi:thioredoxin 1